MQQLKTAAGLEVLNCIS